MAPVIRMKSKISGTRDGVDWPAPGGTLEVPEEEAAQLVAGGLATLAEEPETAVDPAEGIETATTKGKTVAQVRAEAKDKQEEAEAEKAKQEEADRVAAEAAEAEKAEADRLAAEAKTAEESKGAKK